MGKFEDFHEQGLIESLEHEKIQEFKVANMMTTYVFFSLIFVMILFVCHPITILFIIFFMIMNDSIRDARIKRRAVKHVKLKNELKSCLSVVDDYKKEMSDIMYIDLCNSLLTAYEQIEKS